MTYTLLVYESEHPVTNYIQVAVGENPNTSKLSTHVNRIIPNEYKM